MSAPNVTPLADLRKSALAHYDEISAQAHHWSSVIPRAINFYFDAEEAKAMTDPTPPAAPRPDDELCAKCDFTLDGHRSNTGVIYPCWTPSGRYRPRPVSPTTQTYLSGIDGGRLFTQAEMDAVEARHAEAMERGARATEAHVLRQRAAEQDATYSATLLASVRRDVATALNGTAPRDALEDIARLLDAELVIARPVSPEAARTHTIDDAMYCLYRHAEFTEGCQACDIRKRSLAAEAAPPRATTPGAINTNSVEWKILNDPMWHAVYALCRQQLDDERRDIDRLRASLAPSRESGALPERSLDVVRRVAMTQPDIGAARGYIEYLESRLSTLERDAARMREALEAANADLDAGEFVGEKAILCRVFDDIDEVYAEWEQHDKSGWMSRSRALGAFIRARLDRRAALAPSGEPTTPPETSE